MTALPRVSFVLGKGGVGRSTVAVALAQELARRGDRTLVFGWSAADPIAPWFGLAPAGLMPTVLGPRLAVANYRLEDTLRLYFVEHLKLPRFYRHVIDGAPVRKLIAAAPGFAELFFVGHLWWLTTLAEEEAGLAFDRIVVDAPATGHGVSLLDLPAALSSIAATELLATEGARVKAMLADPAWSGAFVVTLAEELAAEETAELVPRITQRLGRPPLAAFVNRSVGAAQGPDATLLDDAWAGRLAPPLEPDEAAALATVRADLRSRGAYEAALRELLRPATAHGVVSLPEHLLGPGPHDPRAVLAGIAPAITRGLAEWSSAPGAGR